MEDDLTTTLVRERGLFDYAVEWTSLLSRAAHAAETAQRWITETTYYLPPAHKMFTTIVQFVSQYGVSAMSIVAMVATIGGIIAGWVMTLAGLPGNWLIFGLAVVYDLLLAPDGRFSLGWLVLGSLLFLAIAGEVVEFAMGAIGIRRTGGSRRSAAVALVGSFLGGIGGAMIGLPIPVAGPVIGVLLFASLGALVGAVAGEYSVRRELKGSLKVGGAAFFGRIFGSIGKTIVGGVMVALFLLSLAI